VSRRLAERLLEGPSPTGAMHGKAAPAEHRLARSPDHRAGYDATGVSRDRVCRMSSGSEDFDRLARLHARVMGAAIRRVCGRRYRALVPDVEQEVHFSLWKLVRAGKEIANPTSYLYKMALTTALAVVRGIESKGGLGEEQVEETPAASNPTRGGLGEVERRVFVKEVLDRLDPDESRALRAYLAGFNHREVAAMFGWSVAIARHRIYRSIQRLKRELPEREPRDEP